MSRDPELLLEQSRQQMEAVGYEDRAAWYAAWENLLEAEREVAR